MARAAAYDEWEDAGLAFSQEEVGKFDQTEFIEKHLATVIAEVRVLHRRNQMDLSKPEFVAKVEKALLDKATWEVKAAGVEALDMDDVEILPSATTKEGKELSKKALDLNPGEWLGTQRSRAESTMRYYVTMSRRAATAQKWSKAQQKRSNRIANALHRYILMCDSLEEMLRSLPKARDTDL